MTGISDMDWAQHIMMDYAQNMRKDPTKAKNFTFRWFIEDPASPFNRSGIYRTMAKYEIYTIL